MIKKKIDSYKKGDLVNGVIFIKHTTKGSKRKSIFLCVGCNKETEKRFDAVRNIGAKFCKICATKIMRSSINPKNREPKELTVKKAAFRAIKKSAEKRDKFFNIGFSFVINEIVKNCTYCGIPPYQLKENGKYKFLHHGLDRVDNNIGYVKSNVVSCCITCNNAKASQTLNEWKEYINRLIIFNKNK